MPRPADTRLLQYVIVLAINNDSNIKRGFPQLLFLK